MRVKHIWDYVPLPAKFKLAVDRITFNRITLGYFIFSAIHCLLQVVFRVQAFTINAKAASFLSSVIDQGNATERGFTVLGQDLWLCDKAPHSMNTKQCKVIWSGESNNTGTAAQSNWNQNIAQITFSDSVTPTSTLVVSSPVASTSLAPPTSTTSVSSSGSSSATILTSRVSQQSTSTSPSNTRVTSTVTLTVQPTNLPELQSAISELIATPTGFANEASEGPNAKDNSELRRAAKRDNMPHNFAARANKEQDGVVLGIFEPMLGQVNVTLDQSCLLAPNWAVTKVENTKREDIVFICFSFWVLGMSTVAILNESFPHIIASLLTHILATIWAGLALNHTNNFHAGFTRLVVGGTCRADLLPGHWSDRAKGEIPVLALNCLALIVSGFLSWRLMTAFGWQTFKRIGASFTLRRAYHYILVLSIAIQLAVFFTVASVAIWLDQIFNGEIGQLTTNPKGFEAATILVLVLLIPWLALGWIAVRREHRLGMGIFLALSLLYLVGWGAMFDSPTFRWTFREWIFFALMDIASAVLALTALVVGVVCRFNFGKGLPYYLNARGPLPGDDFLPCTPAPNSDIEKVPFPSNDAPIPTFSATFGNGLDVPPPTHMDASRVLGPRFYNSGAASFDALPQSHHIVFPGGLPANPATGRGRDLTRQPSGGSSKSGHSPISSYEIGKKWVIE